MSIDTVAVTGGSGTIGQHLLAALNEREYHTVNINRGRREKSTADEYVQADLLDPGDTYGALTKADADAVVHLGMIPTPTSHPEHTVYESNAMSSYYVLEAAQGLGIDTAVLASSLSALGAGFEDDPVRVTYLPIDEAHPLTPSNPYGMGKQTLEVVADGFGRRERPPITISSIRFPWVMDESQQREHLLAADRSLEGLREAGKFHNSRNMLFGYLHVDDAVRVLEHAIMADFEGHERFWAVADDTTVAETTPDVIEEVYPQVEQRAAFKGHDGLFDTDKAAEILGWQPRYSWRDLF